MSEIGAISYALVSVLYATLCVLLLTSWRGRHVGGYLIAACVISTAWAITLSAQTAGAAVPAIGIFTLEVLRGGAWLTFLLTLLAQLGVPRAIKFWVQFFLTGLLVAAVALWLRQDYFAAGPGIASFAIPSGLLIALGGLILIEQLYRNTPPESRQRFRALVLGLGGMFAFDLFLYSQGMLFGILDTASWSARGTVNILFIPMIAIAARQNPDWDLNIFVSRQVIFYSTSLVAVGVYLFVMSLGGYALMIYGGIWGELAQIVFFVGAIIVLVVLLFSSTVRARFRVFLSKHFFRNKYDYREEWLRLISTLTGFDDSSTRQIVVKAMAQIIDSPGGLLWSLDTDGSKYQLTASYNSTTIAPDIPADIELVGFIKKEGWLIDLEEYRYDREMYGDLKLPEWLSGDATAWLIVPLMFRQQLLGLVLLKSASGPPKLNYEDRDLLKTVGNHLAVHLAQEKSDSLLAEAQQFEAYNRLTAFLMHDLNNLIAQQSLIIKNAEKHKRNPDFIDDSMQTIAGSVERMKRVMDQLKRGEADRLARSTELRFIISTAIDRCSGRMPIPSIDLDGLNTSVSVDAEEFTMVLVHLIKNAQDATPPDGSVGVLANQSDTSVAITVEDSGCGMPSEFIRDHLFKPFDSTKGSQGMGIGAYQAREFARKMGGDIDVHSVPGQGTAIILTLPLD